MPKRSEKRDTAKAEYIARKARGEEVSLRELAKEQGVGYQTLRNWKAADKWDEALPKRKRGGQPGNRNSAGKQNAAGSHPGAPVGNKNAEKDGAYSAVFFDMLTDCERELVEQTPLKSKEALEHEMKILKFREHKILAKITEYESAPEDSLYISSLMDMRVPGGRGKDKKDGAVQSMGMYSKDSAFNRALKLQEALRSISRSPRASPAPSATPASRRSSPATITRNSPGSTASPRDGFGAFAALGKRKGRSGSSTTWKTPGTNTRTRGLVILRSASYIKFHKTTLK